MIDKNKLKLAEQFIDIVSVTLKKESEFYSSKVLPRIEIPTKASRKITPIVTADMFEKECMLLNKREHPFQRLIDKDAVFFKVVIA